MVEAFPLHKIKQSQSVLEHEWKSIELFLPPPSTWKMLQVRISEHRTEEANPHAPSPTQSLLPIFYYLCTSSKPKLTRSLPAMLCSMPEFPNCPNADNSLSPASNVLELDIVRSSLDSLGPRQEAAKPPPQSPHGHHAERRTKAVV